MSPLAARHHPARSPVGIRLLASVFLLVGLTACSDGLFHPDPEGSGPASVSLVLPSLNEGALDPAADGIAAAFGKVDRVRVVVRTEPQGQTLLDQTVQVGASEEEVRLRLDVPLTQVEQLATLAVEMRRGADPLFAGVSELRLARGRSSQAPVDLVPVPHRVEVLSSPPVFSSLGQALEMSAFVVFATGDVIPGLSPTWSSSGPGIVEVSPQGRAVARAPGTTTLQASHPGAAPGTIAAEVRLVAVSLEVSPAALLLREGNEATLSVSARDAGGSAFTPDRVNWSSSNEAVATVSAAGVVTARLPGDAVIRAEQDGVSAEAAVQVEARAASIVVSPASAEVAAGATLVLSASVVDARGDPIVPPGVTWTSSNPAVATVSSEGQLLARAPGTAQLRAERDGFTGEATVTVIQTVEAIEVAPATLTLRTQETAAFTATLRDGSGASFSPPGGVNWSVANPGVARIDADGNVEALAAGTTEVLAERDGVTGFASLTVLDRIPQILDTRTRVTTGVEGEVLVEFEVDVRTFEQSWILEFLLYETPGGGVPVDSVYRYQLDPVPGVTTISTGPITVWWDGLWSLSLPNRYHVQATGINDLGRGEPGDMVSFDAMAAPLSFGAYVFPADSTDAIWLGWYYETYELSGYTFEVQRRPGGGSAWSQLFSLDEEDVFEGSSAYSFYDTVTDPSLPWDYRIRACLPSRGICSTFTDPVSLADGEFGAPPPGAVRP